MERDDPYVKKRLSEPTNCSPVSTVKDDEPYNIAAKYIQEKPERNCCTVEGTKVTKWQLPANARVKLKHKSDSVFYYDATKMSLDG